jgi:MYXO-CTERM domain-containing protein
MKLQSSGGCAVAPEGALSGLAAALLALALALARSRVPARTHAQRRTRR